VNDSFPEYGSVAPDAEQPVPVALMIYTEDCDAVFAQAKEKQIKKS